MERNVTNPFIDNLTQMPRRGSHSHAPTLAEIQRWEDDGGAVLPDVTTRRRYEPHLGHGIEELAAAE